MSRSRNFFLLLFGVMLLVCPMSWAETGCFDYSVDAVFSGNPQNPYAPYAGVLNERIDGQTVEQVPATLIIGTIKFGDDGTLLTVNTVIHSYGNRGTLILTEHAVASPTDNPYVYRLNSRLDICVSEDPKCTGDFETAFGRISFHGYMDFSIAMFAGSGRGKICW
ncbi:MAG TPA: hypothetical protein VN604_04675 [Nitrospirota bacterium]|nr:hypothetical protein [Nitrospirota bacterium]